MHKSVIIFGVILLCLTGCVSPSQLTLFSTKSQNISIPQVPEFVIEANDSLNIMFSAVNEDAVKPFNSAGSSFAVAGDGTVELPVIGRVKLAGMNTEQAAKMLREKVSDQVRNPIVRVAINSAVVTILGEVNMPSSLNIKQAISLLDALGRVGGLTQNARCNDVQVLRHENGKIRNYHINLLTDELFSSPCYYLQKGDVVNIAPLRVK